MQRGEDTSIWIGSCALNDFGDFFIEAYLVDNWLGIFNAKNSPVILCKNICNRVGIILNRCSPRHNISESASVALTTSRFG